MIIGEMIAEMIPKGGMDTISKIIGLLCFFIVLISYIICKNIKRREALIVGQIILLIVSAVGFYLKAETACLGLGCSAYFVYMWMFYDKLIPDSRGLKIDGYDDIVSVNIDGKTVEVCCDSGTYKEVFDYVRLLGYKYSDFDIKKRWGISACPWVRIDNDKVCNVIIEDKAKDGERKIFWKAELIYKPEKLTEQGFEMYFDNCSYKPFQELLDNYDGNKNHLFCNYLNTHTLTMIKEALTDKEFSSSLERVNKALHDWDIKISCVADSCIEDGKEIPFNQINQATRNLIAEDILENGNVSGMEYGTISLPSLDD